MSDYAPTWIIADFAGQRRKFELRIGEIGELERLTHSGIAAILTRLVSMQWRNDDVRETIRLALIGGGTSEAGATGLALYTLDVAPKGQFLQLAADILAACINGAAPKKADGEGTGPPETPATSSPSTGSAAASD